MAIMIIIIMEDNHLFSYQHIDYNMVVVVLNVCELYFEEKKI